MTHKASVRLVLPGAVLLFLAVSGCSEGESGFAQPGPSAIQSSVSMTPSVSAPTTPASASIDPCDLISAEDLAEAGEFESEHKERDGVRACFWQKSAAGGGDVFTFVISVRDSQGIETMNDYGGGVNPDEVNQRPAVTTKDPKTGDCTFAMKLSDSSRVDVTILEEEGPDDSCEIGKVIAEMFEPRLPAIP